MKEEWRLIPDYPKYYISSFGRIWSTITNKMLSPRGGIIASNGKLAYYNVSLRNEDGVKTENVHTLVAQTFIPNPNDYPLVRHLDDNRLNNRVDNLIWGTYLDNYNDAVKNGLEVGLSDEAVEKGRKLSRDPIYVWDRSTCQKVLYESINDAARFLNTDPSLVVYWLRHPAPPKSPRKFSAEYALRSDKIMDYINHFPEYRMEVEWVDLPDGGKKRIVHNWFRGVDLGTGGYIVGNPGIYENVVMLDIASMHPSSIIALNLFGDEYTKRFKELVDARVSIKHGDFGKAKVLLNGELAPFLDDPSQAKALANALKLAINSVYGMTYQDYEGNPFYDKRNINNIVALRGAIFMKMLQDEMEARGVKVVGIRTDSIKLLAPSAQDIDFAMEFARKYAYTFEFECVYDRICLSTKADYVAKYMSQDKCKELYGWVPEENEKLGGTWTSTAAFFSRPYVFKTLFSHEEVEFKDLCETKERRVGAMYLDINENLPDGEHNYIFVGRVGLFCPIASGKGGGELVAKVENKDGTISYNAVTGTKGYRWLEAEHIKLLHREPDIDMSYFHSQVDEAIKTISQYGDFEWFTRE